MNIPTRARRLRALEKRAGALLEPGPSEIVFVGVNPDGSKTESHRIIIRRPGVIFDLPANGREDPDYITKEPQS